MIENWDYLELNYEKCNIANNARPSLYQRIMGSMKSIKIRNLKVLESILGKVLSTIKLYNIEAPHAHTYLSITLYNL